MEEDHALLAALEEAEGLKKEGNACFQKGENEEAIRLYTQAIELNPENAVYYSNRSAAYLACGDARGKALKDAEVCIELRPEWSRGYGRKGAAEHALKRYEAARSTYMKGLLYDPDNTSLLASIEDVRVAHDEHSKILKEEYKRKEKQEEKQEEKRKVLKEKKKKEDDLLSSFFDDVRETEDNSNCIQKEEPVYIKKNVQFGTAITQVSRLLQEHYKWVNLNPFQVLLLDIDATEEDVKQHYRKLSAIVHPDKCQVEDARAAFEEVKKAYETLQDDNRRLHYISIIKSTRERVEKERRIKRKKGSTLSQLGDLDDEIKREVMRTFAQNEQRRVNLQTRMAKQNKRENDQQEEEAKKMTDDYEKERAFAEPKRREKRMGHWHDFAKEGKKTKGSGPGWKGEERTGIEPKHGKVELDGFKKNWK